MPKHSGFLIYYRCSFISLPLQKDTGINLIWMQLSCRSKYSTTITQPTNPTTHCPRDWKAEQCSAMPTRWEEASLAVTWEPPRKGHSVGSWDMNQKSCSCCCTCFELCCCSWDACSSDWSQRGLLSGKHVGSVPQRSSAHWACCLEVGNAQGVKVNVGVGNVYAPSKIVIVGWHPLAVRWLPRDLLMTFLRSQQDCKGYSVTVMKWGAEGEDKPFPLQDGKCRRVASHLASVWFPPSRNKGTALAVS